MGLVAEWWATFEVTAGEKKVVTALPVVAWTAVSPDLGGGFLPLVIASRHDGIAKPAQEVPGFLALVHRDQVDQPVLQEWIDRTRVQADGDLEVDLPIEAPPDEAGA